MGVLHPFILLAGLGAVSIPVLIHLLLRTRRRPLEWGAMRFVVEAAKRTQRRRALQRWLLLAARCLLLLAAALALARPLVAGGAAGTGRAARTVHLIIDNSIAAQAGPSAESGALAAHLRHARALLDSLREGDRVSIQLAGMGGDGGGEGAALIWPAAASLPLVRAALDDIRATDARADVAAALARISSATRADPGARTSGSDSIVVLADPLSGTFGAERAPATLANEARVAVIPSAIGASSLNVGIASVTAGRAVLTPGDPPEARTLAVALLRSGAAAATAGESSVNGAGESARVAWAAGQTAATVVLPIAAADADASAPTSSIAVSASDRRRDTRVLAVSLSADANAADNAARIAVRIRPALRVALIDDPRAGAARAGAAGFTAAQWVAAALGSGAATGIEVSASSALTVDAQTLASCDAAIVTAPQALDERARAAVRDFIRAGGLAIVIPPAELDAHAWLSAFITDLRLPWAAAAARRAVGTPERTAELVAPAPADAAADLLALVRRELPDLLRGVGVRSVLPVTATASLTPAATGAASPTVPPDSWRSATLLALRDGTPIVLEARGAAGAGASGRVILFTVALDVDWTDLQTKPLIVPLLQEFVRQGIGRGAAVLSATAGSRITLAPGTRLRPVDAPEMDAHAALSIDATGGATPLHAGAFELVDERGLDAGMLVITPDARGATVDTLDDAAVIAWVRRGATVGDAARQAQVQVVRAVSTAGVTGAEATPASAAADAELARAALAGAGDDAQRGGSSSLWLAFACALALCEVVLAWWAATPRGVTGRGTGLGPPPPATSGGTT